MAETFLHGIETIQVTSETGVVSTAKTAVIGLIGTAATGTLQKLYLCTNETEDAVFGTTGTIPKSLKAIRLQHAGAVVVAMSIGLPEATLVAADFVGTVDAETGVKTGLKLFDTCRSTFGFIPKIFIAPWFSSTDAIAQAIESVATKFRGTALIDSAIGLTIAEAKLGREMAGQWPRQSYRAEALFGGVINTLTSATEPRSPYYAGLRSYVDNNFGFWYSISNHNYSGISGVETPIDWELGDESCDANQLNALGINVVVNMGSNGGLKEWGNRNQAFPTNTDVRTFSSQQRLDDITSESIEIACIPYLDKPMTKAQIDIVTQKVQSYLNDLVGKGALLQGSTVYFDATKNTAAQMAAGHYIWTKSFCGSLPGERFTFYSEIDTTLLNSLITL